jgi:glutathione reductase (NADPH)
MREFDFDLFVIGAGSGGVRASRVAASHGAKVGIAEEYRVGGTCVIRGCVPKKLLVYGAHFAEDLKDARRFGWHIPEFHFDWATLRDNVLADVDRLNKAYETTLNTHEVEVVHERATTTGPHSVRLASGRTVTAKVILVATGARPRVPEVKGAEYGITSNEVFHLDALPKRVVIAGGGYIANEFAGIFHEFGVHVTIVNRSDEILRGYDESVRDRFLQISRAKGIDFRFNSPFERIEKRGDGTLCVRIEKGDPIICDLLIFAVGRVPNTTNLGLETTGVELDDRRAIIVDEYSKTTCKSIYAVGDVTDRAQLTPVAIREGHAFADTMFGGTPRAIDYGCIPTAVFSHPPMAGVGMTEAQARNELGNIRVFISDFRAMKNVLANRNERAFYKMIVDAATDEVVGLHMIGPDAPEILQAAAVAVKAGLTKRDFDATVALHPTMAEELVLLRQAVR